MNARAWAMAARNGFAALLVVCTAGSTAAEDGRAAERAAMVQEIAAEAPELTRLIGERALEARVLAVLREVPRHVFVPDAEQPYAYENRPLDIGRDQTISQPLIVAVMTSLLHLERDDRVLEIGTGSGYQAAVLARLAAQVHTIEIVPELAERARAVLRQHGYANVAVRAGDGWQGWPEAAPFDAVLVTAASPHVPERLVAQLKPGGRMVLPVGRPGREQQLTLVEKLPDGGVRRRSLLPVRFVPMTGGGSAAAKP